MLTIRDLLKAILVEEGIQDQDAYLEGRILDCVIEVSDDRIVLTHGTPVPSDIACLDNVILYGAWVYSFNEDALCHTFEYRKDVQAAYILYKELKNNAECSNVEVMFASSLSDEIYEVVIKEGSEI